MTNLNPSNGERLKMLTGEQMAYWAPLLRPLGKVSYQAKRVWKPNYSESPADYTVAVFPSELGFGDFYTELTDNGFVPVHPTERVLYRLPFRKDWGEAYPRAYADKPDGAVNVPLTAFEIVNRTPAYEAVPHLPVAEVEPAPVPAPVTPPKAKRLRNEAAAQQALAAAPATETDEPPAWPIEWPVVYAGDPDEHLSKKTMLDELAIKETCPVSGRPWLNEAIIRVLEFKAKYPHLYRTPTL